MPLPDSPPDATSRALRLTLTFDNGPTPGVTQPVLETLGRYGIRTTFFIIGQKLLDKSSAVLLSEFKSAGHWIGNHTLSHSVAFGERPDENEARREIEEAQSLIGTWPDQKRLFRPYGKDGLLGPHLLSTRLCRICAAMTTPQQSGTLSRVTGESPTAGSRTALPP